MLSAMFGHFPDLPYAPLPALPPPPAKTADVCLKEFDDLRAAIFAAVHHGRLRLITKAVYGHEAREALHRVSSILCTMRDHGWVKCVGLSHGARWSRVVKALPARGEEYAGKRLERSILTALGSRPVRVRELVAACPGAKQPDVSSALARLAKRGLVKRVNKLWEAA